jgi:hypothetical protein
MSHQTKSFFDRKTSPYSRVKGTRFRTSHRKPLVERSRYSADLDKTPRGLLWLSAVVVLLLVCSPAAVIWGVSTIVVATINGEARTRSSSHVFEKSWERGEPAITHSDTSSTVVLPFAMTSVVTPELHLLPSSILDAILTDRFPVFEVPLRGRFAAKTTTRPRSFADEESGLDLDCSTTGASTQPMFLGTTEEANNVQPTDSLPLQISWRSTH